MFFHVFSAVFVFLRIFFVYIRAGPWYTPFRLFTTFYDFSLLAKCQLKDPNFSCKMFFFSFFRTFFFFSQFCFREVLGMHPLLHKGCLLFLPRERLNYKNARNKIKILAQQTGFFKFLRTLFFFSRFFFREVLDMHPMLRRVCLFF